jgi:Ca2+-binding RTX toxin-like protein
MTTHNHLFDSLESRRMMSASLKGTTLNLRGTPQADNYVIRRSGSQIVVERNGVREGQFAFSKVQRLSIVLGDGDDTLQSNGRLPRMMVDAGNGNDTVRTSVGDDFVSGGAGDDIISTSGGSDTVDPGAGHDGLAGGTGINTLDYSSRTSGITVNLATGQTFDSAAGDDNFESFSIVLGGSGNDTLSGTPKSINSLFGNAGNDTLTASGADDELYGGAGDDTLVDAFGSTLLDGGDGRDTADYFHSDHTSGVGVKLNGMGAQLNARGEYDQLFDCEVLLGTQFPDILEGSGGNDLIDGKGGGDSIIGHAGIDTLLGGDGNDYLEDKDGNIDQIDGGAGTDFAAPDFNYFPFGRTPKDALTNVETVGDPKAIVV